MLVQGGDVAVNGEIENRRGRMLRPGDTVEIHGEVYRVCLSPD